MSRRIEPQSKLELITFIHSERRNLEETLAQLNEDQLIHLNVEGEWSVKDILAHIIAWEKRMVRWMSETVCDEIPEMPAPGMSWDDLDHLSYQTYLTDRYKPLTEVLEQFKQSFVAALQLVENTSDEDLMEKERFSWREGNPLWKMVAANTYWHYKMHNQSIMDAVAKSGEL